MILKRYKKSILSMFLAITVLFISLITIDEFQLKTLQFDIAQYLMSTDPGFSTRVNIVGKITPTGKDNNLEYKLLLMSTLIKTVPKIIHYKLFGRTFDRIDIDIKHLDYQKIKMDRKKAVEQGLLVKPNIVKAKIRFKEKNFNAKIRLKGDLLGHWISKYRMSLRIKLKGNETLLGYNSFSIHKPVEREYPYDDIFQKLIRDLGNLSPRHQYINVYVNGIDWGIMDMEEHMSKVFLESQQRKESAIVRFSDERPWLYTLNSSKPYEYYRLSDPSLNIKLYNDNKYLKDLHYRIIYSYISKHQTNYSPILYNVDSFSRAYILGTAWGEWHTLAYNNTRYYFNPYSLELEPITTDQTRPSSDLDDLFKTIDLALYEPLRSVTSTQKYSINLNKNLHRVNNILPNLDKYLKNANILFPVDKKITGNVIKQNMVKIISNKGKNIAERPKSHDTRKFKLPSIKQSTEFLHHVHAKHFTDGRIEIFNLLPDTVVLSDVLYKGDSFLHKELNVPSYFEETLPTIVKTSLKGLKDFSIDIVTSYKGNIRKTNNGITLVDKIKNPLLFYEESNFKGLVKIDQKNFLFKKGEWLIDSPLVIEGNLNIAPGTKLKFSKNAYLIVKGTLIAVASQDLPISFEPLLKTWKGLYVLEAGKKSYLNYVHIKNTIALEDELLKLTGGVTFYKADVDIRNTTIEGALSEDAINIVNSKFEMESVFISNTLSDGLDSDFSNGTIRESIFSYIGGDAIDLSGSSVDMFNVKALKVNDKAVSVGEASKANIVKGIFHDVGVGVASKDGSSATVSNSEIKNYKIHAVMSYMKKDFYSKPSLHVLNSDTGNNNKAYLRQTGSVMTVDNDQIQESALNVEELYNYGIMRKP
jgi:hypothetical protein